MPFQKPSLIFHPINWVQRVALYVTHSHCYLIGSNNTQTAFKILKIDRTVKSLTFIDDKVEYNYQQITDLLTRLFYGNITKDNNLKNGISKTVSSFGLLGFVKFLHGYYLILVTQRCKVASIGYHTIYKVEGTELFYIPNEQPTKHNREEERYVKAFTSIDLTSNFYFSYSYDLTHSLQYNLSPIRNERFLRQEKISNFNQNEEEANSSDIQSSCNTNLDSSTKVEAESKRLPLLVKTKPSPRFIWNSNLIDFEGLHDDWKIYLVHGFVAQANICVYSKPIFITIIARRSRCYCGTRFLKRGLNLDGDVANEVETEQIVHDASVSNFSQGFYTSFVQLRGSLPDRWSQDASKITPKPTIIQDFIDPYHEATAKHFNDLLKRYGTPVVALNLIKQNERKPHESVLKDMLDTSVSYLNQFLPKQHIIRLIAFDMAKSSKSINENVMQRLGKIGFNIIRVTGIFQSWRSARKSNYDNTYTLHLRQRTFNRMPSSFQIRGYRLRTGQCLQNGVVRVNCVDCLDRTNTAQFVLGKVALAFQLHALGVLTEPNLDYDTDAVRLLEKLYEDHGDAIALQYAGSQLVHRVNTYRKVAPVTSLLGGITQTLSRYYSNTFSDQEKQNVINIFLGVRKASKFDAILSSPTTDYYLHNQSLLRPFSIKNRTANYTQWWDKNMLKSLPRAYDEFEKESNCYLMETRVGSSTIAERIGFYFDAYRPYEMTFLETSFSMRILNTIRDFKPKSAIDSNPFSLRTDLNKSRDEYQEEPSVRSEETDSDTIDNLQDLSTHPTAANVSSKSRRNSEYNYTLSRYLSDDNDNSRYTITSQTSVIDDNIIFGEYVNFGKTNCYNNYLVGYETDEKYEVVIDPLNTIDSKVYKEYVDFGKLAHPRTSLVT